ncbi:hypothetical protein [Phaeobacter inhibens]|uniref:hypothetical protein n=1 Tax=Phaeobacter inhibens TaxID=221822 RepID=UPI0021A5DADC|nr:hypothetical protein [Phaeobacter inhibens]UWR60188.1 hypothetical protein K4F88_14920 [Phaeobacter inhibens]
MNDDDDVLMVSFTDALTCVLAASIALFLIFVAMIKLAPSDAKNPTSSAVSRMRAAVAQDLVAGDSTALLRIASRDCAIIESLELNPPPSRDFVIRRAAPGGKTCARLFSLSNGLRKAAHVVTDQWPTHPVTAFLEVGAVYWPPSSAKTLPQDAFYRCRSGKLVLVQVENKFGEFLGPSRGGGCS